MEIEIHYRSLLTHPLHMHACMHAVATTVTADLRNVSLLTHTPPSLGMDNPSPVIHFRTASGTLSITKVDSPATQQQPDAQDPTTTTTSTIITTSLTATHGDHLPAAASVCPAGSEGVTAVSGGAVAVAVAGGGGGRGDRALQLEMSLPLAALTETPAVLQRGGPGGDGACVRALLAACVGDLVVEHIGWVRGR